MAPPFAKDLRREEPDNYLRGLKKVIMQIQQLSSEKKQSATKERKARTRTLIQMGGLVAKAKLDQIHEQDKALLLGIFLDAMNQLEGSDNENYKQKCRLLGKEAFNDG